MYLRAGYIVSFKNEKIKIWMKYIPYCSCSHVKTAASTFETSDFRMIIWTEVQHAQQKRHFQKWPSKYCQYIFIWIKSAFLASNTSQKAAKWCKYIYILATSIYGPSYKTQVVLDFGCPKCLNIIFRLADIRLHALACVSSINILPQLVYLFFQWYVRSLVHIRLVLSSSKGSDEDDWNDDC